MAMIRSKQTKFRDSAGFTLVELIIATSVSGIVLASMVATFITFAIGARSIGSYTDMSKDSRYALEYFARDMRAAEDVLRAEQSSLAIQLPSTSLYSGEIVAYNFDDDKKLLTRVVLDSSGSEIRDDTLLEGVERFNFSYFDPLGRSLDVSTASILLSVKSVQVDAEMVRALSRTEATDYIISARFMMRNRPVTE